MRLESTEHDGKQRSATIKCRNVCTIQQQTYFNKEHFKHKIVKKINRFILSLSYYFTFLRKEEEFGRAHEFDVQNERCLFLREDEMLMFGSNNLLCRH